MGSCPPAGQRAGGQDLSRWNTPTQRRVDGFHSPPQRVIETSASFVTKDQLSPFLHPWSDFLRKEGVTVMWQVWRAASALKRWCSHTFTRIRMSYIHVCVYGEGLAHSADGAVGLCPRHIIYLREAFLQQEYILNNFRSTCWSIFSKIQILYQLIVYIDKTCHVPYHLSHRDSWWPWSVFLQSVGNDLFVWVWSHCTQELLMKHQDLGISSFPEAWRITEKTRESLLQPYDVPWCLRTSQQVPTDGKQY